MNYYQLFLLYQFNQKEENNKSCFNSCLQGFKLTTKNFLNSGMVADSYIEFIKQLSMSG